MKKKISGKKLTLTKETVRKLNDADLRQVVGGATKTCTQPPVCGCTHTSAGPSHPIFC